MFVTCVRDVCSCAIRLKQLNKAYGKARMDYAAWIQEHYPTRTSARRQGVEATQRMVEAFPELKRVRGYVHNMFRPRAHAHMWCVDPTGQIVDPTVHQWPYILDPGQYEAIPDGAEEPHGMCMECGKLCYKSRGATAYHCEVCMTHV